MTTGPTIKRGQSSGDIWTPKPFVRAVEAKFGPLAMDLAASPQSNCAPCYFTEKDNALSDLRPWPPVRCWLNPPYADITPWAEKCARESAKGCEVLLLVPGSVGANWYWDWVEPYADVYSVGRLVFDNCYDREGKLVTTPYPKDLILCHYNAAKITEAAFYGVPHRTQRMARWHWRKELS